MRICVVLFALLCCRFACFSQSFAPNIGFENGTFDNWVRSFGTIDTSGNIIVYPGVPYANPFIIYSQRDAATLDPIGNFPVLCPNGSKYSVMLGDTLHGNTAQRLSYTLTVPSSGATSIVFDYAVVLQNPMHVYYQQPRFTLRVFNVTDNTYLDCPSFDFISSDNLPGFKEVGDVFYKEWSAATIDLKNFGGKVVRLDFTVNHCSFGAHFGYVYLDVDENVGAAVTGNAYCHQQNKVTLTAPVGFAAYSWYTGDFTKQIGNGEHLTLSPPPPDKSVYAVVVSPYNNVGCIDTLYTTVDEIDDDFNLKVADTVYGCPGSPVDLTAPYITAGTSPGTIFTYYTDAAADTSLVYPNRVAAQGTYYIQGTGSQGCTGILPVYVDFELPVLRVTNPPALTYPATADVSATFAPQAGVTYSYYVDASATIPLVNYQQVALSGTYYIKAENRGGCVVIQPVTVTIQAPPYAITAPNTFTPNNDGINDLFGLTLKGYVNFLRLRIYNRYGALVYNATSPTLLWDGTLGGRQLPAGVYYWLFEGEYPYNHTKISQGAYITLIR